MRKNKKESGMNLVELAVVMAIAGMLMMGMIRIFQTSFNIWSSSLNTLAIQRSGRAAVEEMTRFIRQSTSPVTGISPAVGATSQSIKFTFFKASDDFVEMEYYKSGSSLYRVANNSTSTLVKDYVDSIYFTHVSSYVVKIENFKLTKGSDRNQKSLTFERTINIRNR